MPGLDYPDSCGSAGHYCPHHEYCGCEQGLSQGRSCRRIIALAASAAAGIVQAWMASATVTYMEQHQDYVEKKAQEIQKELQQMEQQNQEQLKRLRDAEDSSHADETGSQDL